VICGIDVGIKKSYVALLEGEKVILVGELKDRVECDFCGIDAPLSYEEPFRDCDRELLKMGISVVPLSTPFMKKLHEKAVEVVQKLDCREVYEVYPYATRKILGFDYSKKRKDGRKKILDALREFVEIESNDLNDHEIDAITSALTVKLYKEGKGVAIGKTCKIIIPANSF